MQRKEEERWVERLGFLKDMDKDLEMLLAVMKLLQVSILPYTCKRTVFWSVNVHFRNSFYTKESTGLKNEHRAVNELNCRPKSPRGTELWKELIGV